MRCTCWDGSSSTKTCLDDGSGFAACVCPAQCGNGVVENGEECDDGNAVKTDSCISCKQAKCGDGFVWSGHEACDDGNTVDSDACPSTCKSATCGDGFVWASREACDDGNATPNDGCENNCTKTPTVCGNGIKEPGEQCDDGNLDNTDSCTEHCEPPKCGDGFVQSARGEDCDDGNTAVADGCNNDCLSSGKVLWSRTFAGAAGGDDVANGVAVDKDGNIVVVGGTTVTNLGLEMLIWKLGPNGDEIVSRTVAGIGDHPDMAQSVALNSLNQMAIVGATYSESTPNVGTRIWYGLFTPTANAVWTDKTFELGNGYGVAVDAQDNMYFAGNYYSSTTTTYDAWVRRINSLDRSVAWTGTFDYGSNSSCSQPSESPRSIALKSGGTVLLAGHYGCGGSNGSIWAFSMDTGAFLRNTDGCRPTWVINDNVGRQVDEDGIHIANNGDVYLAGNIGGSGEIWRYAPDLCGTGNCQSPYCAKPSASISAGTSKLLAISGDGTSSVVAAGDSGYVVKMNLAGSTLWNQTLEHVDLKGIAVDPTGYIYVVGTTTSAVPTARGDAFVAKLTP
jgi:cysteine-rich repeat protein